MRVPSIGLTRDERRIVAEGYRLAEYMLRNYHDKPSLAATVKQWLERVRVMVLARD
ncbi:hypothetical protein [Devosia sp. Root635]|uniref:hypothetical protein n=1 Tax=Devosia sp. Root635 TaxID=1736575 RepID=UPI000AA1D104|nr:hypothetical protein [Devosia sp. Root635]